MAEHLGGRVGGELAAQAVGPVGQGADHGPAGLPGRGQRARDRVAGVGGGQRGLQLREELAPAGAVPLPADQPGQLRGRRGGVDPGHGGAELAPLGARQAGLGAVPGIQHGIEGEREPAGDQIRLAGPGRERRQDPGDPPAVEVGGDRRARHGLGAGADLEEPRRPVARLDAEGPRVGVVADREEPQPGDPDPEAGLERPDDRVLGQVGWLTHDGLPLPRSRSRVRDYTCGGTGRLEAPMTLVVNLLIFAGIALIPLGLAVLFIKLGRRFSSSS